MKNTENIPMEESDQTLFEAVAARLRRLYQKEHGVPFNYGCFEFIFHQGRFQGVEERARNRRYLSRTGPIPSNTEDT